MALETLKDVKSIGGFELGHISDDKTKRTKNGISKRVTLYRDLNVISFKVQDGPIKENGVNGCQVDTIVEAAKLIIEGLNKNYPCRENSMAITKLDEALMWMRERTRDRETRGVEGLNKA